jgi:hypothetical protein
MLIFWKQRLVILATPKTGSTAIEAALDGVASTAILRPPEMKHTPAYRFQRFLKPYLQNSAHGAPFEAVALMREPVDWLASWYRFRQRPDLDGTPRSSRGMDFDAFAAAYMASPRPEVADVGGQARFLSGTDGAPLGVDRVFRYENMPAFVSYLEARLDMAITLPRLNVSPSAESELSAPMERALRTCLDPEYRIYQSLP